MNIIKNSFLILMVSSSLLLSGCDKISAMEYNKAENFSADIGVTGSESVAERKAHENDKASLDITEMKTIEPPEDGWTYEQLNKVISINGITYDYPVTLGTLLETYTYDKNLMYIDNAGTFFYYKNTYAFGGGLEYNKSKIIDDNTKLVTATFTILDDESQLKNSDLISINGVKLGDSYEKMITKLGLPNIENENISYKYLINNKVSLAIYFLNTNEIQTIQISWEDYKNENN